MNEELMRHEVNFLELSLDLMALMRQIEQLRQRRRLGPKTKAKIRLLEDTFSCHLQWLEIEKQKFSCELSNLRAEGVIQ
jgi:hypothetical protein